jgi:ArsR family transcriptional regulator
MALLESVSIFVEMDTALHIDVCQYGQVTGPACCPTGLTEPLDRETAEDLARLMKAVADPARLQILALLRSAEDGSTCICDIAEIVGLSQPTVSHHVKVLAEAGLVTKEKRGYWTWVAAEQGRLAELAAVLI